MADDNINVPFSIAFREQINSELLQFDINQTIMDLQALAVMEVSLLSTFESINIHITIMLFLLAFTSCRYK